MEEFKYKENYLYKLFEAARTERNICTVVQKQIPERQLRPLARLDPTSSVKPDKRPLKNDPEGGRFVAAVG